MYSPEIPVSQDVCRRNTRNPTRDSRWDYKGKRLMPKGEDASDLKPCRLSFRNVRVPRRVRNPYLG